MRRPPALRTAFVILASAAAPAARAAPAVRLQASPDFTLVLPHVEPDSVGVDLQLYDPRARAWRKWGEFDIARRGGATTGGRIVFRAPREGEFLLRAAARDEAGNTDAAAGPESADVIAVCDRAPPEMRVTSPAPGAAFEPGAEVGLAWRTTEAHPLARGAAAVEISADGGRTWRVASRRTDDTGEFRLPAPETEGSFLLRVTVVDACGNRGRAVSPAFEVRSRTSVVAVPVTPVGPGSRRPAVPSAVAAPPREAAHSDAAASRAPVARTLDPVEIEVAVRVERVRVERVRVGRVRVGRPRPAPPVAEAAIETATNTAVATIPVETVSAPRARAPASVPERPAAGGIVEELAEELAEELVKGTVKASPRPPPRTGPVRSGRRRVAEVDPALRALARAAHAKGAKAFAAGRLDEAATALREAVAADPSREGAWLDLSAALARSGKLKEALTVLERAEARFPKSPDLPLNRGLVLVRLSRAAEARAALERAVGLKPSSAEAHWTLGLLAVGGEDLDLARGHWRAVVKWTPACSSLHKRAKLLIRESE